MCSVWLLSPYPMLHSTSCLGLLNAFGKPILVLVLKIKSFAKAWCRTWFVASLHPLCHVLVLGSMCSSIHVSYLMVGCPVLISYLCASYMLFTLWFLSWHLLFIFHSPVPWIHYIGYTPQLLFKTMCIITRNSKTCMHNLRGSLSYMLRSWD